MMVMTFCGMNAYADNITPEQAKEAAAYFIGHYAQVEKLTADDVHLVYQIDNMDMDAVAVYFFQSSCGWMILAGTTVVDPIIAVSAENNLDVSNLPNNMMWYVNGYADMISEIQLLDAQNNYPDCNEWLAIKNKAVKGLTKDGLVLLTNDKWDQGDENYPTYNLYCPQASDGRYSMTGCVATALGMLCHYYRYPVQPTGRHKNWRSRGIEISYDTVSFDYSIMPTSVGRWTQQAQKEEVAKLLYSIGVAVDMEYSPDGSGTTDEKARLGMKANFKYENAVITDRNGTNDTAFVNRARRELVDSNVLYMTGYSPGSTGRDAGHAWLITGYTTDNTTQMYMNWGWGGSSNGLFNLATNSMRAGSYNFTSGQSILFGMVPPADSNIHYHGEVGINSVDHTVLGTAYPNPATMSVTLPYRTDKVSDLNVYSIDGRLVATHRVQPGNGAIKLRVAEMSAGIYIYRLNSVAGKFVVR